MDLRPVFPNTLMRISRLKLHNFRNHTDTEVEAARGLNLITGPNGAGKTNLIDAIHYLCMSRSFVTASDLYIAHQEHKYFMAEGRFHGKVRSDFTIGCSYSRGEGKKVFVNKSPLERFSDLIGLVPVVVLSPSDAKLTSEGPAERRSFLDSLISQTSPTYLRDLIDYRKVRRQRNRLFQEFRGPESQLRDLLEPWDAQLASKGASVILKRAEVLGRFSRYLELQYRTISGLDLHPSLKYVTITNQKGSVEEIEAEFQKQLKSNFGKEAEREQTLIGPHRDEVLFYLGEMELRKYGSQGQHRLFSMALKMAQLFYYLDELEDFPILLLDDIFGNLDPQKSKAITETVLKHAGQTFITAAADLPLDKKELFSGDENRWFQVEDSIVTVRN